jgi:hypothetical protein
MIILWMYGIVFYQVTSYSLLIAILLVIWYQISSLNFGELKNRYVEI